MRRKQAVLREIWPRFVWTSAFAQGAHGGMGGEHPGEMEAALRSLQGLPDAFGTLMEVLNFKLQTDAWRNGRERYG